jgi:head-tail adaptor
MMKEVLRVQERTATLGTSGETVTWAPVETRHAEVIPVSAQTRLAYQQLNSEVTHKVIFKGLCTVRVGDHRFQWGSRTLIPTSPAQVVNGNTVVMVKERWE